MSAPKIAAQCGCHPTTIFHYAAVRDLPHPGRGYFQKKARIIPPDVLLLMQQLDAEEAQAHLETKP
jgi:hypothetical protein